MNRREFIIVSVITCFVILVWVIAEIIHAQPSIPQDSKIQTLLDPINPNFDQKTLQEVNQVRRLGPSQASLQRSDEEASPAASSPSTSPTPSPSPASTPSARPEINISTPSADFEQ